MIPLYMFYEGDSVLPYKVQIVNPNETVLRPNDRVCLFSIDENAYNIKSVCIRFDPNKEWFPATAKFQIHEKVGDEWVPIGRNDLSHGSARKLLSNLRTVYPEKEYAMARVNPLNKV